MWPVTPEPLWQPGPERRFSSRLHRYLERVAPDRPLDPVAGYDQAWRWSVSDPGAFWTSIAAEHGVIWHRQPDEALVRAGGPGEGRDVEGARWFTGSLLNYAEHALRVPGGNAGAVAVLARSQTEGPQEQTWSELRTQVARVRTGLALAGVGSGDRVAGYLPNTPVALACMLATASLGAVWTCCAPEMGVTGVLDRFAQVEPAVLVAADGYRYGALPVERVEQAEAIRQGLPTVVAAVWVPYLDPTSAPPPGWMSWEDLTSTEKPLEFAPVAFDHPLYILYSSGTTGPPKAVVHGHGGVLLEHLKVLSLHFDIGPGDRFFWFTTTGWMMWNFCVSGLLVGATVVLFDGSPSWPGPDALWAVMAETRTTCGGTGAGYLVACMKAGLSPGTEHDLSSLVTLGSTGSPLPGSAGAWVYQAVGPDLLLASFSGGTDVCTGFVGASPLHPVWPGEISCRCLGAAVETYDDTGQPVIDHEGELVLTAPLPSMPVRFWADPDGTRYHDAYFERFPGIWAHGDRMTLTSRGSCIITGRSDGTLNRGGVRLGTAELYDVIEADDGVADSLVVHVEDPGGGPGLLWLFVVPAAGAPGGFDELAERLRTSLRRDLSPRHVPDRVIEVAAVPRTLSGKKLEVPVKRLLSGTPLEKALALASVANPECLDDYLAHAGR